MEHVRGIGGFFFTSPDSAGLSKWYCDHLGVTLPPQAYDAPVWTQAGGPTVFAPMPTEVAESPIVGTGGWGLNFRVDDLVAMVGQLRDAGVTVDVDDETYPNGRFAQLVDPDGNAVQLWEPS